MRIWVGQTRSELQDEESRKLAYADLARKIVAASVDRKKDSFGNWRGLITEGNRVKDIQKRFLTRLLMSKAGRVAEAFRIIKNLPEMADL